jgi:predicted DNA-binding transcriptional regulator YafY
VLDTSARLLRLLALLQARRFWTGSDLAERLEVTERTVRRDVDRLRSLGYPVDGTAGVAGGYHLGAGARMPPLLLEDDEALAVTLGLGTAVTSAVSGIDDAALRALVKLEQVLPSRLRRRVTALKDAITPLERERPAVDAALLAEMASACRDHQQLQFRYTPVRSEPSERNVEPQGLVHSGGRWYLVAWDLARNDWRTFRVDRITDGVRVGARCLPRHGPEGGIRDYVSRSLAVEPYPQKAAVMLAAPMQVIARTISPAAGMLEPVDECRCMLRTGGGSLESLAVWLLHIGVDFEVLEPPELVTHVRALYERIGRALSLKPNER